MLLIFVHCCTQLFQDVALMISYLVDSGNMAVMTSLVNVTAPGTVHKTEAMNVIVVRNFFINLTINRLLLSSLPGVVYHFDGSRL